MSNIAIQVENLGKLYRLGEVGTGTLSHDLNRWWAKVRGKEDPFTKIGEINDRTQKGNSDYVWALKDVNFDVKQGEIMGIIGRNGAGKSTMLKLLSKVTKPTTGRMMIKGRIASLLEVGTGFHPEMTGRENIFLNGAILGMTKREIRAKFDEIVDFAGVERYVDTPVKRYSSGMYVRLAFAVAAHLEPEILIVDEVLAVGDAEFQKKCLGKMKDVSVNGGRTVLFVSHNMTSISTLCNSCLLMESGGVKAIGETNKILNRYLGSAGTNYVTFKKHLKFAQINQVGDTLRIEAAYETDQDLDIPHLGFVIYDLSGTPLFGSNPSIEKLNIPNGVSSKRSGFIEITITDPKLVDGEYIVSIWFGNSTSNFLSERDCLRFEVIGMTKKKTLPGRNVGYILPRCNWKFT